MKSQVIVSCISIIAVVLFGGCADISMNMDKKNIGQIVHFSEYKQGVTSVHAPSKNQIKTSNVGENMYEEYFVQQYDTKSVVIDDSVEASSALHGIMKLYKGSRSLLRSDLQYVGANSIEIVGGQHPFPYYLVDVNNDMKFDIFRAAHHPGYITLNKPVNYRIERTPETVFQDSLKYQVLYQAKSANRIKISFREFKDNYARPAFTQDVEYELESDGTSLIGFKNLRIKVLKATNFDITYQVVEYMN